MTSRTDAQYLRLSEQTNRLIEFTDGVLEVLPRPTSKHQRILLWFYRTLFALVEPAGGIVLVAALPVQIRPGQYREPDVLLLLDRTDPRYQESFWLGADLVIEVVSPRDRKRDTRTKRGDYAVARIPEYWIVNPLDETITVLTLRGPAYGEHGVFRRGTTATSVLLPGWAVRVDDVFDAR
ncbi:MAG TPA: Uma2 family endonuclease [Chloroflexia bacterium]|nr:Uma2 family endonuclease [Chloroflexia bacterium]